VNAQRAFIEQGTSNKLVCHPHSPRESIRTAQSQGDYVVFGFRFEPGSASSIDSEQYPCSIRGGNP
jgi:hypothetical protein